MQDPQEKRMPICPVCGAESETFYRSCLSGVIGCDVCISKVDAYEEEYMEEES